MRMKIETSLIGRWVWDGRQSVGCIVSAWAGDGDTARYQVELAHGSFEGRVATIDFDSTLDPIYYPVWRLLPKAVPEWPEKLQQYWTCDR